MIKIESKIHHLNKKDSILKPFSESERAIIEERMAILTPLCKMISGDLDMEVELNPGEGWHWDFEKNIVRCDPKDLLNKSMDFLRFVIQHEAGHRKVSRIIGVIPDDVWQQPGFGFMTNAIEDPRMNSYVADTIPKFRQEMNISYDMQFEEEIEQKAKEKLGEVPRFLQAGFEYIKYWFAESKGEKREIDSSLPKDVIEVVEKTLPSARRSWNLYPTKQEIEKGIEFDGKIIKGEELITEYARQSYIINRDEVYPLFKTLIEKDKEDAKERQKQKGGKGQKGKKREEGEENEMTDEEIDKMIEDFFKELEEQLNKFLEGEYQKQEEEAKKSGKVFQPTKSSKNKEKSEEEKERQKIVSSELTTEERKKKEELDKRMEAAKKAFEKEFERKQSPYDKVLQEMAPVITRLEDELREIFIARKRSGWESGKRSGARIDIRREIVGEATGIEDMNVFMKKELPLEQDYAITLLVDLSGSMDGDKIDETYKAVVVLSEALNNIGIKMSVVGFNDVLYDYKDFDDEFTSEKRQNSGLMKNETHGDGAAYNDDAWAVKQVYERIKKRPEKKKIVFVFSDGEPAPSSNYRERDLKSEVMSVEKSGDVQIIGLGVGPRTGHVARYYSDNIANIGVHELAKKLADKVRSVIEK